MKVAECARLVYAELAVKWLEMVQTGLPLTALSAFFGPLRLATWERELVRTYSAFPHIPRRQFKMLRRMSCDRCAAIGEVLTDEVCVRSLYRSTCRGRYAAGGRAST